MTTTLRTRGSNANVSMKARARHWEFSQARLEVPHANFATYTVFDPFAVRDSSDVYGSGKQLCGTILTVDEDDLVIIGDVTPGSVYWHNVRNVLTYSGSAENTFGAILEGTLIYFDRTNPNSLLTLSPLDSAGHNNVPFGRAVLGAGELPSAFPKGTTSAGTYGVAVMQLGFVF